VFIQKNTLLKEEASKTANTEFMIQLPENYNKNNKYPLLLILHGGIGNIPDLQMDYMSDKLKTGFILAYFHGASLAGTYTRAFSNGWAGRVKKGYDQIITKYAVDSTKVIIAGPSAGGARSIILGVNYIIPAKGLLLSFAVTPGGIDSTTYINSAKRGLKIALLCGENDWAIKAQKELGVNLDKYGFTNRFVVFPEKGHEYPDNWSYHLDTSLEFILKEE
jgi:predicted peptidase